MRDLVKQEEFEIEVLDKLQSGRFLEKLIFTDGTMLRLCYGLDRFSVDLNFWLYKKIDEKVFFTQLKEFLTNQYTVKDAENKFYTMLFEVRTKDYPRSLKIEVRKEIKKCKTELAIAYSKHSNRQVLVRVPSLEEVLQSKVEAFITRGEIRDAFDIEFLVKRGIDLRLPEDSIKELLKKISSLKKRDYTVKLGSILEPEIRRYYLEENFKILRLKLTEALQK